MAPITPKRVKIKVDSNRTVSGLWLRPRRATLIPIQYADHSFHVPVRSGRTDEDIQQALAAAIAKWLPVDRVYETNVEAPSKLPERLVLWEMMDLQKLM